MRLGRALAPLADEGIWIIGSGSTTHNLSDFGSPKPWVAPFVDWLEDVLISAPEDPALAREKLAKIMQQTPHAHTAHPRTEHLMPLIVAFGAALPWSGDAKREEGVGGGGIRVKASKIYSQIVVGTLSL